MVTLGTRSSLRGQHLVSLLLYLPSTCYSYAGATLGLSQGLLLLLSPSLRGRSYSVFLRSTGNFVTTVRFTGNVYLAHNQRQWLAAAGSFAARPVPVPVPRTRISTYDVNLKPLSPTVDVAAPRPGLLRPQESASPSLASICQVPRSNYGALSGVCMQQLSAQDQWMIDTESGSHQTIWWTTGSESQRHGTTFERPEDFREFVDHARAMHESDGRPYDVHTSWYYHRIGRTPGTGQMWNDISYRAISSRMGT
ncbi:hypothetical protein OH76DRAFT_867695 [Lentinus brumalis]|uniref:Uncharacterized protein n=1 Tax=Lentinus brumalis TaxID=2498619 RepID=A0A371DRJ3_9APHY|nr:hypothetical protein OH76DRAFT_867695 [Polyporus brumalis]